MTIRFYAACLASYNNGRLYGAWIDASADVDAMESEVAAMLRGSPYPNVMVTCPTCEGDHEDGAPTCATCNGKGQVPSAEEWAMHDSEGLPSDFGEYPGLKCVAAWCELVDAAEDRGIDLDLVSEIASHYGEPHKGAFDETLEAINDRYLGAHDSLEAYAESYIEDTGMLDNVADTIQRYFDFQAFGRDLELGGDVFTIRQGGTLHVFDGH